MRDYQYGFDEGFNIRTIQDVWRMSNKETITFIADPPSRLFLSSVGKSHSELVIIAMKKDPGLFQRVIRGYWLPDRDLLVLYGKDMAGIIVRKPSRSDIRFIEKRLGIEPLYVEIIERVEDEKTSHGTPVGDVTRRLSESILCRQIRY